MPQCPKCGAPIKDDYGMVACASCEAFLFIDMDGNAHIDGADASAEALVKPIDVSVEADEAPPYSEPIVPAMEPQQEQEESPQAPPMEFQGVQDWVESPAEYPLDADEDVNDEQASQIEPVSPFYEVAETNVEGVDPLGISEYANSEISQGRDGLLLFNIHISGIDTKEIRESIREAISDSRFAWDVDRIMGAVSRGALQIENVPSVKASVLVNRLKRLPLQIKWEQHAITQVESQ